MHRCAPPFAFVLAAVLAFAAPFASARDGRSFEAGIGYADEIEGESSYVATLGWLSDHAHPYELVLGHIAERDGGDDAFETPSATFIGASKRLYWRRWFASVGVALTDVENDVLSSTGQFMTGAGFTADRWTISVRHLSNADTGGRNRGETFVLFAFRF